MDALIFMLIGMSSLADGLYVINRVTWTTIKKHIFKENKDDYTWFYIEDIC